jgi:hypothetical protein
MVPIIAADPLRAPCDLIVPGHGQGKTLIHVCAPSARPVVALLQAISTEVAHITFAGLPSAFALGAEVETMFILGTKSVSFRAVVLRRVEKGVDRHYMLQFIEQGRKQELAEVIHRVCNVRKLSRVVPRANTCSLDVRGNGAGEWMACTLKDLSCGGVGFLYTGAVEPDGLAEANSLEMRLGLPTENAILPVDGTIVNRVVYGGAIRYGVKFEEARPGFNETKRRILEYVDVRQQESLRELSRNITPVHQY